MKRFKAMLQRCVIFNHIKTIILYCFYIFIMQILNVLFCLNLCRHNGFKYSIADNFVMLARDDFFPISIVSVSILLLVSFFKYDFRAISIIKQKTKISMWLNQVKQVFFLSALLSILMFSFALLLSLITYDEIINFSKEASLFHFFTKSTKSLPLYMIILVCFLSSIISFITTFLVILLSKWIFNSYVIGFITVIIVIWNDIVNDEFNIFFGRNSSFYYHWLNIPKMILDFLSALFIIIILIVLGIIIARKKEFIDAN